MQKGQRLRFGSVPFLLAKAAVDVNEPNSEMETPRCHHAVTSFPMDPAVAALSEAQYRVFTLVIEGLAQKQIARRLKLSTSTVHNHIQAIYRILKVHSRSELLARFLRNGDS